MTYMISTQTDTRRASSKAEALVIARKMVSAKRLYKGAEYQQDAPSGSSEGCGRIYGMATDYWESRVNAARQMNCSADVVIMAVAS